MSTQISIGASVYFTPDDDVQQVFCDALRAARESIRIAIYAWHLPVAVAILTARRQAGVDVGLVVDHSQAAGRYEAPEIAQLVAAGCDVTIGTSQRHAIMHHKFAVIDDTRVLAGSWNFSLSASQENNFIQIVDNAPYASAFLTQWAAMRAWMRQHEPQYQPGGDA
jgi:phosphatidylserine/phosphatidylglycerophosphate/cardiolipin synthase-like enzyme